MDNDSNAGLQLGIDALVRVMGNLTADEIDINYADLMAFAGMVGAEYGMEGNPGNVNWPASGKSLLFIVFSTAYLLKLA